jgi:hypothetical protein
MRHFVLTAIAALALFPVPAFADQNFIPSGRDYGVGNDPLPPLNSEQDQFDAQVDVYQSEVYNRNLGKKQFDSRIENLMDQQNPGAPDDNDLDY